MRRKCIAGLSTARIVSTLVSGKTESGAVILNEIQVDHLELLVVHRTFIED